MKLPKEFSSWCAGELKKLGQEGALSLVAFLYNNDNPAEVRQYMSAYLGTKPEVANFATEFIARRKQQHQLASSKGTAGAGNGDNGLDASGGKKKKKGKGN